MSKTTLSMKGISTPRVFIWFRGFMQGRIIHTGGLDPETNIITSGYVTGQTKKFRKACVTRREIAEQKLAKLWCNADELLFDYSAVTSALARAGENLYSHCESNAQTRFNERATEKRMSCEAERQTILKNLAQIANDIRLEYNTAHDQMEATAELLAAAFACYGHGLLMKPVYAHNLPTIKFEDCADQIIVNHQDTWDAIVSIIREVKE